MEQLTQSQQLSTRVTALLSTQASTVPSLQKKLGYDDKEWFRIKALANMQFLEEIALENPDEGVTLEFEGININCPQMDSSGRFELTDKGAVDEYGEEFLSEWCKKASLALKKPLLVEQLKEWSLKTTYVERYPYRNPIEQFGLVWQVEYSEAPFLGNSWIILGMELRFIDFNIHLISLYLNSSVLSPKTVRDSAGRSDTY